MALVEDADDDTHIEEIDINSIIEKELNGEGEKEEVAVKNDKEDDETEMLDKSLSLNQLYQQVGQSRSLKNFMNKGPAKQYEGPPGSFYNEQRLGVKKPTDKKIIIKVAPIGGLEQKRNLLKKMRR